MNIMNILNFQNVIDTIANTNWQECLLAILAGGILGYIFAKFNLPIPAPPVLAGILGIVGIWLGYLLAK